MRVIKTIVDPKKSLTSWLDELTRRSHLFIDIDPAPYPEPSEFDMYFAEVAAKNDLDLCDIDREEES